MTERPEGPLPERIGPYVVEGEIGRGGMGVVYLARDPRLKRRVAIKAMLPGVTWDVAARERLAREAEALAAVSHPNVAVIHGVEDWQGTPHLVLEHVPGRSLAELLEDGPLPLRESVAACRQVALGLAALHERGLVHRDLKPDNVRLTPKGLAKLLDFGLAKPAGAGSDPAPRAAPEAPGDGPFVSAPVTRDGLVIGTVGYMSPEQLGNRPLGPASDAWAWGCLLFECLAGAPAFPGTREERTRRTLHGEPDWARLPAQLPGEVRALLLRCLSRDPSARPALDAAAEELEAAGAGRAPDPSKSRPPRGNLPRELDALVGREMEVAELAAELAEPALVTLTGPGGCGKSRLALELARALAPPLEGGAWLVELAQVREHALVTPGVAAALGLRDLPGVPLEDQLVARLSSAPTLVVLDNCEHLLEPCARLAARLLASCPELRLVATSQEILRVRGERVRAVAPLEVPDEDDPPRVVAACASVRLLVERARAVRPGFEVDETNARALARACRRLDGIPLALELAAARLQSLSPEQLAGRLDDRFRLLTGGGHAALPRHQTLRACLDWSHDLLGESEKVLLRRLAVFEGGFSLDLAEASCPDEALAPEHVAEALGHLVDRSLVQRAEGEPPRFRMLETVRQHAREKLVAAGEQERARSRHALAVHDAALAVARDESLTRAARWRRLLRDEANALVALEWLRDVPGGLDSAVRLALAFVEAWDVQSAWSRGRQVVDGLLARGGAAASPELRRSALLASARLALRQADLPSCAAALDEAEALPACGRAEAAELRGIRGGLAIVRGDLAEARVLLESAAAEHRAGGATEALARVLGHLALVARMEGRLGDAAGLLREALALPGIQRSEHRLAWLWYELAAVSENDEGRRLFQRSLDLRRQIGDRHGAAVCLEGLASLDFQEGDVVSSEARLRTSLPVKREIGDRRGEAWTLDRLARVARAQGRLADAAEACLRALALRLDVGFVAGSLETLELAAWIAIDRELHDAAATLLGAVDALRQARGSAAWVRWGDPAPDVEAARESLGRSAWDRARQVGTAMTLPDAADRARSVLSDLTAQG